MLEGQEISPKSGDVHESHMEGKRWRATWRKYCPIMYCERCHKRCIKRQWFVEWVWVWDVADDKPQYSGQNRVLCFGCYNTHRALRRKWLQLEEMRLTINRCKKQLQRKHNEST